MVAADGFEGATVLLKHVHSTDLTVFLNAGVPGIFNREYAEEYHQTIVLGLWEKPVTVKWYKTELSAVYPNVIVFFVLL